MLEKERLPVLHWICPCFPSFFASAFGSFFLKSSSWYTFPLPSPSPFFPLCCPTLTSGTYVILAHGHRYDSTTRNDPDSFLFPYIVHFCVWLLIPGSHLALISITGQSDNCWEDPQAGNGGGARMSRGLGRLGPGMVTAPQVPLSFTASSAFSRANTKGSLVVTIWAWRTSSLTSF